jgi:dienelactone hydrolase
LRLAVGFVVCLLLPAASWAEGSAMLAWTMYSRTGELRVDLVAYDATGRAHLRNPAVLADGVSPDVASLLAGSDHWRPASSVAAIRDHLDDLALHACRELGAASVAITLHERSGRGSERVLTRERTCPP